MRRRVSRAAAVLSLASVLVVGAAGSAHAGDRKARQPTKPPPAQSYQCKKGGKVVKATSVAAAATACRGYGGLK